MFWPDLHQHAAVKSAPEAQLPAPTEDNEDAQKAEDESYAIDQLEAAQLDLARDKHPRAAEFGKDVKGLHEDMLKRWKEE